MNRPACSILHNFFSRFSLTNFANGLSRKISISRMMKTNLKFHEQNWNKKNWFLPKYRNTDSIKINRPGYNIPMYVLREFLTVDHSYTTKFFWKNSYRNLTSISLRFFWHLLCPNWSIIRDTVSICGMFGNRQIAAICYRRKISSIHCAFR